MLTQPRATPELLGGRVFNSLVRAVGGPAGAEPDAQAFTDAAALWVALHGYASLQNAVPAFPWPDPGDMLDLLLDRLLQRRP